MKKALHFTIIAVLLLGAGAGVGLAQEEETYIFKPGDEVRIEVFLDPDLSRTLIIRPDGKLSFPFIGDFTAAGMTVPDLDNFLTEKLGALYEQPDVTITPLTYAKQSYYVFGDVTREGEFPLIRALTVAEGLSAAGFSGRPDITNYTGATFVSDVNRQGRTRALVPPELVLLVRKSAETGGRITKPIYLRKFLAEGGVDGDTDLFPGDILYVPENLLLVYVLGEVANPGSLRWTPDYRLFAAISDAGHWTEDAKATNVALMRSHPDGTMTTYRLNLWKAMQGKVENNPVLEPGDTIYIARNLLAHMNYFFRVFNQGSVQSAMSTYQQAQAIEALNQSGN